MSRGGCGQVFGCEARECGAPTGQARSPLGWLLVVALAVRKLRQADGILVASTGFAAVALTCVIWAWADRVLQLVRASAAPDERPLKGGRAPWR